MTRTKKEIRDFLNSQVGKRVNAKAGVYNGQCVTLIKALLEFLGVPDPYAGRGNAKDVGDTLLRENIAENGKGWLTVVVNRSMGVVNGIRYGHIWLDIAGYANYEQNGAQALTTTKNTRPLSQGQQFVNLDKYIKLEEVMSKPSKADVGNMFNQAGVPDEKVTAKQYAYYMARDWSVLGKDIAVMIRKMYNEERVKVAELEAQLAAGYEPAGELFIKKKP